MIIDLQMACKDCPLWKRPYVPATCDALKPIVMAIGTAPGPTEEQVRKPFVGDVGSMVVEVLTGIVGSEVYYTNLVKRMPITDDGKPRKPNQSELKHCGKIHLAHEIESFKPPIIVSFGSLATSFIMDGQKASMEHLHGLPTKMSRFGYEFILLPVYDPGYVVRRGGLMSETGNVWLQDLQELEELVKKAN